MGSIEFHGRVWLCLAGIAVVYLCLAVAADHTFLPWCDEAWFAMPGINLATDGSFGTPVLDETAVWNARNLRGVNHRTYWFMPLDPVMVAGWSFVAGKTLLAVRTLSAMWGLLALAAWFAVVLRLSDSVRPALFMAGLLAVDFEFIWYASNGRMDMMTEALLASSFASYLWLRETNFTRAVVVSHIFMMLAGMTHPISLGGFAGLIFLTIYLDRSQIRIRHLFLAAIPYVIAGAAWGLFIAQDPAMFRDQFYGNITGRLSRTGGLAQSLWNQYKERFLFPYGFSPESSKLGPLKLPIYLAYLAGLAWAWCMRDFRAQRKYRAWLILCLITFFVYSQIDKDVHEFYIVHIMAPAIAVFALVLDWLLRTRRVPALAVATVMALLVSLNLLTSGSRIRKDSYHTQYLQTTAFLKQNVRPGELVIGSTELGWELGWKSNLVDDYRLGYLTGKRPDIIVLDRNRYQEWIPNLQVFDPKAYRFTTGLLASEFRPVHSNEAYTTYFRVNRPTP